MGLDIMVGTRIDGDGPRKELSLVQDALAAAGLPAWHEPEPAGSARRDYEMWGYGGLHELRRLAAHRAATGALPKPLGDSTRATADPLLAAEYVHGPRHAVAVSAGPGGPRVIGSPGDAAGGFDHLVHHSDCDGYYVPVDFAPVLVDERITGAYVGSSQRLLEECRGLAALMELPEDLDPWSDEMEEAVEDPLPGGAAWRRHGVAAFTCLQLIAAARHSVGTGTAIVFW
ncbi:hypothetical protein [Nonomuraea pusilla]|uniref:Uncharacterized protein n=1 Tax=Nonomuraea pusilla TaxID=46177 RepID=A0A1H7Y2A2_9ACTN|nr:hypothetical protein [Nonomuraea pusilla]SEM39467.1 hypothetical protein SAMN05660976_05058 [Nonomuraea pusilla]